MEMFCADCGCLVDRGVRISSCGKPGCCCLDLPTRASLETLAEEIRTAFATRNLADFGALLAEDARWGDDEHPNRCRSRADVIAAFDRLLRDGVGGAVTETATGPAGVLCRLRVEWPDPADRTRGEAFYHLYRVRDGRIAAIQRYDDRASALEALGSP